MTLQEILAAAVDRYGNQGEVGARMGVDRTRVSRAMRGEYSFEVPSCLRLAMAMDLPPGDVLRAAGKGDVADLLDHFYERPTLTSQEKDLLRQWGRLPEASRVVVRELIDKLPKDEKRPTKRSA